MAKTAPFKPAGTKGKERLATTTRPLRTDHARSPKHRFPVVSASSSLFVVMAVSKTLEAELRKTPADLYKQIGAQGEKLEQNGLLEKDAGMSSGSEETKMASPRK